jgi:3-dehydro-4-phosphotetronate decarboxylase
MAKSDSREQIAALGADLSARGLTPGSTGNISLRDADRLQITPTGAVLSQLQPADIAVFGNNGRQLAGRPPSKELGLHEALYRAHPDCRAIVHVHSLHTVAVSCIEGLPEVEPLPRLTPYFLAQVPELRTVPYRAPGSRSLVEAVASAARISRFLLLRNHGSIVAAAALRDAADAVEEIEQAAALALLLDGRRVQTIGANSATGRMWIQLGAPPGDLASQCPAARVREEVMG